MQQHRQPAKWPIPVLVGLIAACLIGLGGCADDTVTGTNYGEVDPAERNLPEGYEERYHEGMRYGLFVPPSYDAARSYPLIVRLHGSTDTTSWDLNWYHDPIQSTDPVFVLTPKSLQVGFGWGLTWQPTHTTDMLKTLEVIALLQGEFNIDADRLYIHGASMGGLGVLSVLAKEPGLFAGAIAICGGGHSDPQIAANIMQTPLWIFHGSDDPVVPVTWSRTIYQAILNAGGTQVRYTEYPGVGHEAWEPAWDEPTIEAWLLAQEKGVTHSAPDTVEHVRAERIDNGHVQLSWDPPSDTDDPDHQVWYYKIYRDDGLLAEVDPDTTMFIDAEASASSTHTYAISTVNFFFNASPQTTPVGL